MLTHLGLDIRYALRSLAHNRGFALTAVLTLAIGIGANAAIFSVVNAVVLKPLPYADAGRIVGVREHREQRGFERTVMARAEFIRWLRGSRTIQDAAAIVRPGLAVRIDNVPERLAGLSVTSSFFRLARIGAWQGRVFSDADSAEGASGVMLVSHSVWQQRFGSDPALVGRTLIVESVPRMVVGILPPGFEFGSRVDAVVPLVFTAADESAFDPHYLEVYARLRDGVSIDEAQAELSTIARADQGPTNHERGVALAPLQDFVVGDASTPMFVLLGAVGFVLLIACANIANLQLSRSEARQKEMAVRAALGAGRARMLRQLLTENLVLAAIGGTLGVLCALWGVDALVAISPPDTPRLSEVTIDGRVLFFAVAVTILAGLVFGSAPAWALSRTRLSDTLKRDLRAGQAARHGALAAFVAGEVALAVILIAGAGLLATTFRNLRAVPPGFDPASVVTVPISIPDTKYSTHDAQRRFVAELVQHVEAIPGVSAAGVVNALPLTGDNSSTTITIEGVPFVDGPNRPNTNDRPTTPGYLEAMRIPLLRGRPLSARDTADAPHVALINETMAARFWPGQDALGRRFKRGRPQSRNPWITVVGIVADIRHSALREPPRQEMYVPFDQAPEDFVVLAVRSALSVDQLRKPLQAELLRLDPDVPLTNLGPLTDTVRGSLAMSRFETMLMASFAVVALLLAAGGIYGVTSYAVAQRTREFGIRVALGAQWRDVAGLVLRHATLIAAIGVMVGVGGAAAVTRVMRSLLFGVNPGDPMILGVTAAGLTVILLAACLVPARRAATVDPVIALRGE